MPGSPVDLPLQAPAMARLSTLFYGWRIVAAAVLIQLLVAGLLNQAFGAYVAVLADEKGWSKTALAAGAALISLESALLGPALGWLIDRFGTRAIVQLGVVAFGLGFVALSRIETIAGFYASLFVTAIGSSLCGYFPLTVTVIHWFRRLRTRALSCLSLGVALGGLVVPIVAWCMQAFGWRATALGSGILAIVVGIPLARIFRRHPSEVGEVEDGVRTPATAQATDEQAAPQREFTAAAAIRTPAFWFVAVGHALALLVLAAVNVHAISHIKESLGYSVAQASLVVTLATLTQGAGLLLGMFVGDRWDKRKISAACMVGQTAALLMLTFAVHPLFLVGFALVHGVAWGLRGPLMHALRADYFGVQAIGMILGISAFVTSLGQVAGPLIVGALADRTGNYRLGFITLALLSAAGSAMFMLARKPR
jgi:sugar phosphate permease